MSSARKEHIKQLKGPDQFQVRVMALVDWCVKNVRLLVYVAAPLLLILAVAFVFRYVQTQRQSGRVDELGKAQVMFDNEDRKAADARAALQKQIEAIDAKITAAKTPPAPAKDAKDPKAALAAAAAAAAAAAKPDPKLEADKAALKKQAEAIKPDHKESAAQMLAFAKKYEGQPEGWLASMTAARVAIDDEKFADAKPLLETVVAKSTGNTFYQIQSRLALVGVLEELGDYDGGIAQADALAKLVEGDMQPKVTLARGRLQLLKNDKAGAKATLSGLIEKSAASPEAQKARSLMGLIGG